ncbi:MAG TPA: beta/gamma crystallin-related protein [Thermoanaerobaculia bacterium]|jgi:hypothetical protein
MRRHLIIALLALAATAATAAAEHERGATLYRDAGFRGESQTFADGEQVHELSGLPIGNDSVSSVRVDRGCRVTLYADDHFRGEAVTLEDDVADLRSTSFGQDRASSLTVECRRPGWFEGGARGRPDWGDRRGAVLYSDEDFRGREELFPDDDADLRDNAVRQDSVSSVRVAEGCRVVLYADSDFRGAATLLTESAPNLRGTEVGNDRVSSLEVRCDGGPEGVTLYENSDYRGRSETFLRDDPRLTNNFIRQDGVSSARVAPGCVATLYEHADYRGRSTTLRHDEPDLRKSRVGNDAVSSIRVECRRFGRRR